MRMPPPVLPLELALPLPLAAPAAALLDALPLALAEEVVSVVPLLPEAVVPCCPFAAASAAFSIRTPPPVPLPELLLALLLALLEALPFPDAFVSLAPLLLLARLFCALISTAARSIRVPPPLLLSLLADEVADASVAPLPFAAFALADHSDVVPVSIRCVAFWFVCCAVLGSTFAKRSAARCSDPNVLYACFAKVLSLLARVSLSLLV